MLVLTRKAGQTIVIGDEEIIVTFLGFNRDQAVIGIDAPKDVSVHREEIYDRILKEMNK